MLTRSVERRQLLQTATELVAEEHRAAMAVLLAEFYQNVLTPDLRTRTARELLDAAASHADLAKLRSDSQTLVRVLPPLPAVTDATDATDATDKGQITQGHSVVQTVTDDIPFLVDSVTQAVASAGYASHVLIHPQLEVLRAPGSAAPQVVTAAGPGTVRESWMRLEIDGIDSDAARAELTEIVTNVLGHVRATASDRSAMTLQAQELGQLLEHNPPAGQSEPDVKNTVSLLKWLSSGSFIFMGYRRYEMSTQDGNVLLHPLSESGLGLLSSDHVDSKDRVLGGRSAQRAGLPQLLTVTKANRRALVHRPDRLDYIGIKTFDSAGAVTGEHRFLGLFDRSVYNMPVDSIPLVADKVNEVLTGSGYACDGALAKELRRALGAYSRDELFQANVAHLSNVLISMTGSWQRRTTRLFLRQDTYGRVVSAVVFLPRDRFTGGVRRRVEELLCAALNGTDADSQVRLDDGPHALLHIVVQTDEDVDLSGIDTADLQGKIVEISTPWVERWRDLLATERSDHASTRLLSRFSDAFSGHFRADFSPEQALSDVDMLESLTPGTVTAHLYRAPGSRPEERRLKVFALRAVSLTEIMPLFFDFGLEVTNERPYTLKSRDDVTFHIFDFGLRAPSAQMWQDDSAGDVSPGDALIEAFRAVHSGRAESDPLNGLVLTAGLTWQQIVILRTIACYLKQTGAAFSLDFVESALNQNPGLARRLVDLFDVRFNPDRFDNAAERATAQEEATADLFDALVNVPNLSHDRVIRAFISVIGATARTNFYQLPRPGAAQVRTVSLKVDPREIPKMPDPRPMAEIWVYSPLLEGVHLRFGKVARGGLRWSDRTEDFRTEVLGLVKAQMVKNAIIVPTGSKGGFVPKALPDPTVDREQWVNAGRNAYCQFIAAMLDITDNLVDGEVVSPDRVVRYDDDDPYLVVAADKGTAAFSDTANEIAHSYGFWLDDAFASGGSTGYDHKGMAITARGAWESVRRHFLELDVDVQSEEFTAVGIGDMSGDVFGNGMLRSPHLRLIAAFDHRHVFIDPSPDAASSFTERERMFELPRSSWADYDQDLLSAGGGIYPRTQKSIPITAEARRALGLSADVTALSPSELLSAVLCAPVDLFWNGGVGTYVKSSSETNLDIGDRGNDTFRVDGAQLRCRVVGEGGNLGFSQRGRVEAALNGVRINTDAIDNSGGVDSSDQEVNIKILLTEPVNSGTLTMSDRNALLKSMTDDVAEHVLRNNYEQNVLLSNARLQVDAMLGAQRRVITWLEQRGLLDRELEALPSEDELEERAASGAGLTSPEFAVLVAYVKLALKEDLIASSLPDDPWLAATLRDYFPKPLHDFDSALKTHQLRREIIVNSVANSVVNRGGVTFVHRAMTETGAGVARIVKAFLVSREVFGLEDYVQQVEALDGVVPTAVQSDLYIAFRRMLDQGTRVLLAAWTGDTKIGPEIDRLRPQVQELIPKLGKLLRETDQERFMARVNALVAEGVPEALAERTASLPKKFILLEAGGLAANGVAAEHAAELLLALAQTLRISEIFDKVDALPTDDRWDALARSALQADVFALLGVLGRAVVEDTSDDLPAEQRVQQWREANAEQLERAASALSADSNADHNPMAKLTVIVRILRALETD